MGFEVVLNMLQTAAVAMVLLVLGRFMVKKIDFLRRCCIPAPVVGGLIFAIVHLILFGTGIGTFSFDETLKDVFMTIFFTSVGYTACFRLLKRGGKKVFTFLMLAIVMVVLQNILGVVTAVLFDQDLRMGLCLGSIPMVGGHGTAGSYGSTLVKDYGVVGADTLAIAAATFGLVAGSLMGGPIARGKIQRYQLHSTESTEELYEFEGESKEAHAKAERVDAESFTSAAILLFLAAGLGTLLTSLFNNIVIFGIKLTFPTYIGAMVVAAIIRNFSDAKGIELPAKALDLWGSTSLNIFLSIALMTLKLWQLADLAAAMTVGLVAQVLLMFLFANFVVFRVMGRDYEAAVMTTAFCGFGMGATPNAMANMQAVVDRHGPAPQAYFIVPLVGSLFIDFCNGLILSGFVSVLTSFT